MAQDPPTPRRVPGGALPPRHSRPRPPEANGHHPEPPPRAAAAWEHLDADDATGGAEASASAEPVTRFRRVAEIAPDAAVATSGRPSIAVIVGTLVVLAVIVLAVVLYRMAPP